MLAAVAPIGWSLNYYLEGSWAAYVVVAIIGAGAFVIGAFRETVVIDSARRAITCAKHFLWRTTESELIPFAAVTGLITKPKYARIGQGRREGQLEHTGFEIVVLWDSDWGDGGVALESFWDEADAQREVSRLADLGVHPSAAALRRSR